VIAGENDDIAAGEASLNAQSLVELQHVERAGSFVDHVAGADEDGAARTPADLFRLLGPACDDSRGVQCADQMNIIAVGIAHREEFGGGIDLDDGGVLGPVADYGRVAGGQERSENEKGGEKFHFGLV
jgi:hypothetical protein